MSDVEMLNHSEHEIKNEKVHSNHTVPRNLN